MGTCNLVPVIKKKRPWKEEVEFSSLQNQIPRFTLSIYNFLLIPAWTYSGSSFLKYSLMFVMISPIIPASHIWYLFNLSTNHKTKNYTDGVINLATKKGREALNLFFLFYSLFIMYRLLHFFVYQMRYNINLCTVFFQSQQIHIPSTAVGEGWHSASFCYVSKGLCPLLFSIFIYSFCYYI